MLTDPINPSHPVNATEIQMERARACSSTAETLHESVVGAGRGGNTSRRSTNAMQLSYPFASQWARKRFLIATSHRISRRHQLAE